MQCACPQCGALMVQSARSNNPACVCTQCASACQLCLGNNTLPLTREALRDGFSLHLLMNRREQFDQQEDEDEYYDRLPEDPMEKYRP